MQKMNSSSAVTRPARAEPTVAQNGVDSLSALALDLAASPPPDAQLTAPAVSTSNGGRAVATSHRPHASPQHHHQRQQQQHKAKASINTGQEAPTTDHPGPASTHTARLILAWFNLRNSVQPKTTPPPRPPLQYRPSTLPSNTHRHTAVFRGKEGAVCGGGGGGHEGKETLMMSSLYNRSRHHLHFKNQ